MTLSCAPCCCGIPCGAARGRPEYREITRDLKRGRVSYVDLSDINDGDAFLRFFECAQSEGELESLSHKMDRMQALTDISEDIAAQATTDSVVEDVILEAILEEMDSEVSPRASPRNRTETASTVDARGRFHSCASDELDTLQPLRAPPRRQDTSRSVLKRSSTVNSVERKSAATAFLKRKVSFAVVREESSAIDLVTESVIRRVRDHFEARKNSEKPTLRRSVTALGWKRSATVTQFDDQLMELTREGMPELISWTSEATVRRYLRSAVGNEDRAVDLLNQAIEYRIRNRNLYGTLPEITFDGRVIGWDNLQHPVLYTCLKNQLAPLAECRDQMVLVFEEAAKLVSENGQYVIILDMYGFRADYNKDCGPLQQWADMLASVNADRIFLILVVDFSSVGKPAWVLMKRYLKDTLKKFAFVRVEEARLMAKSQLKADTASRVCASYDINRDPNADAADRDRHARNTSICDVPFGTRPRSIKTRELATREITTRELS